MAFFEANPNPLRVPEQKAAVVEQFVKQLAEKQRTISQLEHQIKLLLQRIKGSRRERIDPNQLTLFTLAKLQEIADQPQHPAEDELIDVDPGPGGGGKGRKRRRGKLPQDLPREIVRHELPEAERACPCCGQQRHEIGVESSAQLEFVPAQLKVIQHDRVKDACHHCQAQGVSGNVAI